ncbi:hypothetical protein XENTR_v10022778 [Xenopus tropicalis]|nr:hypothetical protein XENTR_v10022778 [Xenopus tropicalis]
MASAAKPLIAVCQMTSTSDKEKNFATCWGLIRGAAARGACMVFLPEAFDYIGGNAEETLSLAETLHGDTIQRYSQLARECGLWLSLGGFHEKGPNWDTDRRISNSHVVLDNTGHIVSVYRKAHLFDVDLQNGVSLRESSFTLPGAEIIRPISSPAGKLGLGVCYDLRFPEFSLALAQAGAELLTYPSAFTLTTGLAHWEVGIAFVLLPAVGNPSTLIGYNCSLPGIAKSPRHRNPVLRGCSGTDGQPQSEAGILRTRHGGRPLGGGDCPVPGRNRSLLR